MTAAITTPETRRCVRCWETKPLDREHFGGRLSGRGGGTEFVHHCRECATPVKRKQVTPIQNGRNWS